MNGIKAVMPVALVIVLSGCGLFSKNQRPVDVGRNAANVSTVIASLQRAIDDSAGHAAFAPGRSYNEALSQCNEESKLASDAHAAKCPQLIADARRECSNFTGPAAVEVCKDFLSEARAECDVGPKVPKICADAKLIGPLKIRSATFRFAAVTVDTAEAGASLKLLSAKHARASGSASSYEIVMVPIPKSTMSTRFPSDISLRDPLYTKLTEALRAVLDSALLPHEADKARIEKLGHRSISPFSRIGRFKRVGTFRDGFLNSEPLRGTESVSMIEGNTGNGEDVQRSPTYLMLNRATFTLELNYSANSSGGFTWTLSALKVADGTAGASSKNSSVNTLTLEVER